MSEITSFKSNSFVSEVSASWNTHTMTPDGFVCQLTLRVETGKDLQEKANAALDRLLDRAEVIVIRGSSFRSRDATNFWRRCRFRKPNLNTRKNARLAA
jgi:hypothetical protein